MEGFGWFLRELLLSRGGYGDIVGCEGESGRGGSGGGRCCLFCREFGSVGGEGVGRVVRSGESCDVYLLFYI